MTAPPRAPGERAEIEAIIRKHVEAVPDDPWDRHPVYEVQGVEAAAAEIAALRAAGDGGEAKGWRPIETAPKDKKHVLVGRAGAQPIRAWFQGKRWWMHGCGPYSHASADLTGTYAPTHWMPLPEPPALSSPTKIEGADDAQG